MASAGAAALAALLEGCGAPNPSPTASPPVAARHDLFLPNVSHSDAPTPEPAMTATPEPAAAAAAPEATAEPVAFPEFEQPSKLGIAVQRFRQRQIMDRIIADGRPRVVKIYEDLGSAAEIKRLSPTTIVVGHIHQQYDFQNAITSGATDMEAYAADFVARHLDRYQANSGVDFWEGHNEPVFEVVDKMVLYGRFEAERARQMAAHGFKAAVGNFAAGNPPFDQWRAFYPALQAVKQVGGALALHEYSAPTMDFGYEPATDDGSLTLRYRRVYRNFVPPELHVPIVITEAGIDGLVSTDRVGSGWQDYVGYWQELSLGIDAFWAYLNQLQWYDEQLQRDDGILGAAIFVAGGDEHFASYELVGDMGELLTQYLMAHPTT